MDSFSEAVIGTSHQLTVLPVQRTCLPVNPHSIFRLDKWYICSEGPTPCAKSALSCYSTADFGVVSRAGRCRGGPCHLCSCGPSLVGSAAFSVGRVDPGACPVDGIRLFEFAQEELLPLDHGLPGRRPIICSAQSVAHAGDKKLTSCLG